MKLRNDFWGNFIYFQWKYFDKIIKSIFTGWVEFTDYKILWLGIYKGSIY